MRRTLFTLLLLVVLVIAGCKAMDAFLGYDHETGRPVPNAPITTIEEVVPILDTIPGVFPWGEIIGIAVTAIGGGYIAVRRIQKRLAGRTVAAAPTTKKGGNAKTT